MASEAEELRKIRKRVEAMNPPSVGCGVFVGLWLFLGSLLILRSCFGVDALWAIREAKPATEPQSATSADSPPETAEPRP
ncbi:MAG: hypothetical protein ACIAQU_05865 [Phycisphaerales bacterium JB064]